MAARMGGVHPFRRLLAQRPVRTALEIALVIAVLLCVGLALGSEVGRLETDRLRFAPGWFAVAVAGFVVLQLAHAGLWRLQLGWLGSHLPPRRSRWIWCASALARYVPTSMLMPTVRIAMAERDGVPKRRCLASLVYEAALALSGSLVVAAYFVVQLPELEGEPVRWLVVSLPLLALVGLYPRIFGPVTAAALRRFGREPLEQLLPPRALLALVVAYALSFVLAGLALYALAQSLYPVDPSQLPQVAGALAVGFAVSVLAFMLPGGLGAREAGIAAALAPAMPTVVAIAVAVIVRLVQIVIELILAAITPVLARSERPAAQEEAKYGPGVNVRSADRQVRAESIRRADRRPASTKTTRP
jgi:hypothetical protein